jgi:cytochrome P450
MDSLFEGERRNHCCTQIQVTKLNYLSLVIKETLRCYSPVSALIMRKANIAHNIADFPIKKGLSVKFPTSLRSTFKPP